MVEKRKRRRLELAASIQLEYLNEHAQKDSKEVPIDIIDISSSGTGFRSKEKLDADGFYNTNITIWTKEVIPCVIHIIREAAEADGNYRYGAVFVGMNEMEKRKIDIYQLIEELQRENQT